MDRFLLQNGEFSFEPKEKKITISILLSLEKKIDRVNGTGKMHFDQI